ncbi:MAG: hypothetical protein ACI9A7_002426 [Cyclobacteriaceae bacterium]|jgi:hypothetical protein
MELLENTSIEDLGFKKNFSVEHADVFLNKDKGIITCVLLTDYVPIVDFRELFNRISVLVVNNTIKKFIFDKRSLRTFHQPSMEWYFIEWKTEMYKHGLRVHRKILPDLPWFAKAVEIVRKPLIEKFPPEIKANIDIGYRNSIEEAVKS